MKAAFAAFLGRAAVAKPVCQRHQREGGQADLLGLTDPAGAGHLCNVQEIVHEP